jgi:hypothetical protein
MRKLLGLLVLAFVLFLVFTQPHMAATWFKSGLNLVRDGFNQVINFFTTLLS